MSGKVHMLHKFKQIFIQIFNSKITRTLQNIIVIRCDNNL